jgi:hypothetical protein
VTSSSVYDGNGLRLSHTVNGTTTTYTWDAASALPVVIQDGTYSYVYGLARLWHHSAVGAYPLALGIVGFGWASWLLRHRKAIHGDES